MTIIFPGRQLADQKLEHLAKRVKRLNTTPKLQIILVGSDPASHLYVRLKQKAAQKIGAQVDIQKLPTSTSPTSLIHIIEVANQDPHIHGIMVQLPLPKNLQTHQVEILSAIDPTKDVDCLTPTNLGLIMHGQPRFLPATAQAVLTTLEYAATSKPPRRLHTSSAKPPRGLDSLEHTNMDPSPGVNSKQITPLRHSELDSGSPIINQQLATKNLSKFLSGKRIAILGSGLETGKPLANLLSNLGATIIWARSTEKGLPQITQLADILISVTGQPNSITQDMVKSGVIAIDVGTSKNPQTGKLTGDLDFDSVKKKASFITPVPGGIGPLTVTSLLENLVQASQPSAT